MEGGKEVGRGKKGSVKDREEHWREREVMEAIWRNGGREMLES